MKICISRLVLNFFMSLFSIFSETFLQFSHCQYRLTEEGDVYEQVAQKACTQPAFARSKLQQKLQSKVLNMFKSDSKDTRTMSINIYSFLSENISQIILGRVIKNLKRFIKRVKVSPTMKKLKENLVSASGPNE